MPLPIDFFSVFNKNLKASFSIKSFSQMGYLKHQAAYLNLATFLYMVFFFQHQSLILLELPNMQNVTQTELLKK